MRGLSLVLTLIAACAALAGCGRASGAPPPPPLPPTVAIGRGPAYELPPTNPVAERGRPVGRLRCSRTERTRVGVHVEVFGRRQTVIVPAGIGVARPWRGRPPYVRSGRCSYPLRTREPTGVIEVVPGVPLTLGDLFDLWGQPLGRHRVAGFRGRTRTWVNGRPWRGDPRAVPLTRHAQIVVSEDARVPVHARYVFPPGL